MKPIEILKAIKEDIRDKFEADPLMMRTVNLVITEFEARTERLHKHDVSGSLPCGCLKCCPNVFPNMRFNVCPICGNKRCPHASDHNYECTNSNDVGQTGSVYGGNDR